MKDPLPRNIFIGIFNNNFMSEELEQYLLSELKRIDEEMNDIYGVSVSLINTYDGRIDISPIDRRLLLSAYKSAIRLKTVSDIYTRFYGESNLVIKSEQLNHGIRLMEKTLLGSDPRKDLKT